MKKQADKKIFLAGILVLLLASPVKPEEGLSLEQVLEAHCRARVNTASLRAKFVQTRVFTLFDETETSRGELLFAFPEKIGWFYTEPDRSSTVINGGLGWTVLPHIKQVQKFRLEGSTTNRVLAIVGFGACAAPLTDSFEVSLGERSGDGDYTLVLKPTDRAITPYFSRIDLSLDRQDFLPRRIKLYEKSGDRMTFEFLDLDSKAEININRFEFAVPDGFTVVEY
jgi:outer membrane lipoprotein-sorting protein